MRFMSTLQGFFERSWWPAFLQCLIVLVLFLLAFHVGAPNFRGQGERQANEWLGAEAIRLQERVALEFSESCTMTQLEKARLQSQLDQARSRASLHLSVMKFYYARYYMAVAMAMVLGVGAAVSLAFISREGWSRSSSYLVTVFILLSALGTMYGLYPALFQQPQNIESNKVAFLAHSQLENHILTVSASKNCGLEEDSANALLMDLDSKLAVLHQIPVGLDHNQLTKLREEVTALTKEAGAGR